jgi:uncharacterized protein with HEPN domain
VLSDSSDEDAALEQKRTNRLPKTLDAMRESISKGADVIALGRDRFDEDWMVRDAAITVITQLGEEVKRLPSGFKSKHSEIEWAQIAGMRNRLIHEYVNVDYEIVWMTLAGQFPAVQPTLG